MRRQMLRGLAVIAALVLSVAVIGAAWAQGPLAAWEYKRQLAAAEGAGQAPGGFGPAAAPSAVAQPTAHRLAYGLRSRPVMYPWEQAAAQFGRERPRPVRRRWVEEWEVVGRWYDIGPYRPWYFGSGRIERSRRLHRWLRERLMWGRRGW